MDSWIRRTSLTCRYASIESSQPAANRILKGKTQVVFLLFECPVPLPPLAGTSPLTNQHLSLPQTDDLLQYQALGLLSVPVVLALLGQQC